MWLQAEIAVATEFQSAPPRGANMRNQPHGRTRIQRGLRPLTGSKGPDRGKRPTGKAPRKKQALTHRVAGRGRDLEGHRRKFCRNGKTTRKSPKSDPNSDETGQAGRSPKLAELAWKSAERSSNLADSGLDLADRSPKSANLA